MTDYVLVPKVPTPEMLEALHDAIRHDVQTGLYSGSDGVGKYAEVSVLDPDSLPEAYRDMLAVGAVGMAKVEIGSEEMNWPAVINELNRCGSSMAGGPAASVLYSLAQALKAGLPK